VDKLAEEAIYVREENLITALRIAVEYMHGRQNVMIAELRLRDIAEALEGKP
jgi:hypothetical protein